VLDTTVIYVCNSEQTLENGELCCLVETYPMRCDNLDDYLATIRSALLYAKTVTLGGSHWAITDEVIARNRRIGTSMTGVAQFLGAHGLDQLRVWCERGYRHLRAVDAMLSERWQVPQSIKLSSIKPSGSVSLLAGATPGCHFPISRFYKRRVRIMNNSPLLDPLRRAGYIIESSIGSERTTSVVEIPVDCGKCRTSAEVSIWEKFALAAFMQRYWSDNSVSVTVDFGTSEASQIKSCLDYYQYQLKSVSLLPRFESGTPYPQMPYEEITEEQYNVEIARIRQTTAAATLHPIKAEDVERESDMYCDGDKCEYTPKTSTAAIGRDRSDA